MSKVYITSKSKTFEKGSEESDIAVWVINNIDVEYETNGHPTEAIGKSKQKYKITITNLK